MHSHALAKYLASSCNSVLQNKPILCRAVTMWSLLACRKVCLLPPSQVVTQSYGMTISAQLSWGPTTHPQLQFTIIGPLD